MAPAKVSALTLKVPPVGRGRQRRQHRDQFAADHLLEDGGVDLVGIADEAEIDHLLDVGIRIDHGAGDLLRLHHVAVLAAQADGLAAGGVDVADDLLVDRAGQHHLDDLDGLLVGDAQAGGEFRLDAELLQHGLDLRAAAVHHHRVDGGLLEQHHVAREVARRLLAAHGVAAVFHHDDLLVVALHVRQRLDEDARLVLRRNVMRRSWSWPVPCAGLSYRGRRRGERGFHRPAGRFSGARLVSAI